MQPAAVEQPTKVMGRRLVAGTLDYLVLPFVIGVAAFALTADFIEVPFCSSETDPNCIALEVGDDPRYWVIADDGWILPTYGAAFGVWVLNLVILQGLVGASLFKLALGLRVVNEEGRLAGFGKVLIRSVVWIVDGIGCCVPLVGPIVALASKDDRRIGDMAAKTNVVRKRSVGTPPLGAAVAAGPYGSTPGGYGATGYGTSGAYGSTGYGTPGGYGSPGAAPGYGTPETPGYAAATPPGAASGPSDTGGAPEPQWDAERNAWVQWDPEGARWMRYDDASGGWVPLQ
ncbi:MAG: RDD family protein [Acidimicrobiia bacterium]|nr:RDD family protein [Acidimicrobiia bacterium]